jgi:hypothetical protein
MASILKVDTIQDQSGNNIINENADTITIGASGDTIDVPGTEVKTNKISPTSGTTLTLGDGGDTIDVPGTEIKTNKVSPTSGTTLTLGDSGDTITIPSGATITNSGTATGFGKVLQVVTATDPTQRSTTSGTYVTASNTLSVAITPSSASNKILLLFSSNARSATDSKEARYTFFRDATDLSGGNGFAYINKNDDTNIGAVTLDSPNTTSSITYEIRMKGESGFTIFFNSGNTKGNIIAIEIAG